MKLEPIFDTLIYGKGTAKRGNYFMYVSTSSDFEMYDLGYKKKEIKTTNFYVTYKGETILVISQRTKGITYETTVIYDGSDKHNFNKNINRTIERIKSYMTEPYSKYKEKYER